MKQNNLDFRVSGSNLRKGAGSRLPVYKEGSRYSIDPMDVMVRSQSMYAMGGGTIGGDLWDFPKSTSRAESSMFGEKKEPTLKPQLQGKINPLTGKREGGVEVLPVGGSSRQEYSDLRDRLTRKGILYTEEPERFERGKGTSDNDREEQFYSTVTGRPMGTLMGTGSYSGFGREKPPLPPQLSQGFKNVSPMQDPSLAKEAEIKSGDMGKFGGPMAFTGFGERVRQQKAEQYQSPVGQGFSSIGKDFFGAPRYPFSI
jgi:hypothetical protein